MRSEFDAAEEVRNLNSNSRSRTDALIVPQNLNTLIAHVRTYDIFSLFSARIALHHAHLAHALARPARALRCYRSAAHHSEAGSFAHVAARAGEIALRVGVQRRRVAMGDKWREGLSVADDDWPDDLDDDDEELEAQGSEVIKTCRGMGGTLEAIGQVLEACFTPEILKSKYVPLSAPSRRSALRAGVITGNTSSARWNSRRRRKTTISARSSSRSCLRTICIRRATMRAGCSRRASSSLRAWVLLLSLLGLRVLRLRMARRTWLGTPRLDCGSGNGSWVSPVRYLAVCRDGS